MGTWAWGLYAPLPPQEHPSQAPQVTLGLVAVWSEPGEAPRARTGPDDEEDVEAGGESAGRKGPLTMTAIATVTLPFP